ncbi:hypothetical protein B0T25DRAFT_353706 [Lasiosphaeria hispida]|uniref:Uncharacterized protein n=1 Tax=Lasiosphaeria hispida TaxID=260671 RepID=A0AAJ0H6X9_9PEZI|nr:hypothetical protein B0T25DRAFT_353706 [Lasiosphaeria hispida]
MAHCVWSTTIACINSSSRLVDDAIWRFQRGKRTVGPPSEEATRGPLQPDTTLATSATSGCGIETPRWLVRNHGESFAVLESIAASAAAFSQPSRRTAWHTAQLDSRSPPPGPFARLFGGTWRVACEGGRREDNYCSCFGQSQGANSQLEILKRHLSCPVVSARCNPSGVWGLRGCHRATEGGACLEPRPQARPSKIDGRARVRPLSATWKICVLPKNPWRSLQTSLLGIASPPKPGTHKIEGEKISETRRDKEYPCLGL